MNNAEGGDRARAEGSDPWRGNLGLFLLLAAITFFSRVPLLAEGYGTPPDAWRVAVVARNIALTGEYSASRLPGYPVQELLGALFWQGGPWVLNGLTALFSGLAVGFFALSLKTVGSHRYVLGGLALGFCPIIYVTSTMFLSDMWALAFVMAGLYLCLTNRPIIAGISLGIAIGCRMTSGAMIFPLALLLAHGKDTRRAVREIVELSLATGVTGAAAFAPVFANYGAEFFTFYDPTGYPPMKDVIARATVGVWGVFGSMALVGATLVALVRNPWTGSLDPDSRARSRARLLVWLVAIALYAVAYLRLPHFSRYLIPVVPFVILALDTVLPARVFRLVCVVVILSSFVGVGRSGLRPGSIFIEHADRRRDMEVIARAVALGDAFQDKAVVVSGGWLPKIEGTLFATSRGMTEYVYGLDATELRQRLDEGFAVYYLPGIRAYNQEAFGIDIADFGAKPLLAEKGR